MRLSLHGLLSPLHRYCASTLTIVSVLIHEPLSLLTLSIQPRFFTAGTSALASIAFRVPYNLGLLPLRCPFSPASIILGSVPRIPVPREHRRCFILTTLTPPHLRTCVVHHHFWRLCRLEPYIRDFVRLFCSHSDHMATPPALSYTPRTSSEVSSALTVRVYFMRLPRAYDL